MIRSALRCPTGVTACYRPTADFDFLSFFVARPMINWDQLNEMAADSSMPGDVRRISGALSGAMNDWPGLDFDSLETFVSVLKREIGVLSRENIQVNMTRCSPATEAWKAESLCELLVAWENADDKRSLDDLIKQVTHRA
jgi:hypothetical protein